MKINPANPRHWIYLSLFAFSVLLTLPLALIPRPRAIKRIVLYGHKLNGNLLAIYEEGLRHESSLAVRFLTMDPVYYRQLRNEGTAVLSALNPLHVAQVALAHVVVSDHGLHALFPFLYLGRLKFVDVWHGIPFKGFDREDFRIQRRYDAVLVTSEKLKWLYTHRFGFDADPVRVTGNARTDFLYKAWTEPPRRLADVPAARNCSHIILFAPTWRQDDPSRSIFPFEADPDEFADRMQRFCEAVNAVCILRTHINSANDNITGRDRVISYPFSDDPHTERLLAFADALICDWSSIAFDFLLLDRPTIFLDVPSPFKKGFSLGPEYRFGHVVKDVDRMFEALESSLRNPESYRKTYGKRCRKIAKDLYGNQADGASAPRCISVIESLAESR